VISNMLDYMGWDNYESTEARKFLDDTDDDAALTQPEAPNAEIAWEIVKRWCTCSDPRKHLPEAQRDPDWHDVVCQDRVAQILAALDAKDARPMDAVREASVLDEIAAERARQDAKWGEQNHPSLDPVLLNRPGGCTPERMAEHYEIPTEARAKFLCQTNAERGTCTYAHILIEEVAEAIAAGVTSEAALRAELVQTAAVVVAWIEKIDRAALTPEDPQ